MLPEVPLEPFCTIGSPCTTHTQPAVRQLRTRWQPHGRDEEVPTPAAAALRSPPAAAAGLARKSRRRIRDHGPLDTPPAGVSQVLASALRSVAQDGGTHPLSRRTSSSSSVTRSRVACLTPSRTLALTRTRALPRPSTYCCLPRAVARRRVRVLTLTLALILILNLDQSPPVVNESA